MPIQTPPPDISQPTNVPIIGALVQDTQVLAVPNSAVPVANPILQTSLGRIKVDAESLQENRMNELNYLTDYQTMINAIITSESENSQRMGFEIR